MPRRPPIRTRTSSTREHCYSRTSVEYLHSPPTWSTPEPPSDSDSESDCSYDDCTHPKRGRPKARGGVYINNRNIGQQNIVIQGCGNKTKDASKKRNQRHKAHIPNHYHHSNYSSSDSNSDSDCDCDCDNCHPTPIIRGNPRYPSGGCCLHGYSHATPCPFCPTKRRASPAAPHSRLFPANGKNYHPITNDNGKVDLYDLPTVLDHALHQAEEDCRAEDAKKKKGVKEGKQFIPRPAKDILREIEKLKADKAQLQSWAAAAAREKSKQNRAALERKCVKVDGRDVVLEGCRGQKKGEKVLLKGTLVKEGPKKEKPAKGLMYRVMMGK